MSKISVILAILASFWLKWLFLEIELQSLVFNTWQKNRFVAVLVKISGPIARRYRVQVKFKVISKISAISATFWLKWLFLEVKLKSVVFSSWKWNCFVAVLVKVSGPTARRYRAQADFWNFCHFSQFLPKIAVFRADLEVRCVLYFKKQ